MKHLYKSIFLLLALLLPATAGAYSFEVDGIYYNKSGTNVTVTYKTYSNGTYTSDYSGEVTIPSTVTYSGTTYHVTSIGNYAFNNCSGLTSVTIPNSVTSIGSYAFYYCSGLTSVTIPNSVTSIGSYAFCYCSGLTSVNIPNSVTSISSHAFYGCSDLTSVTLPNTIITIGNDAFYGCSSLINLAIPNTVTSIGYYAFSDCSSLTCVTIPNSVTSIGFSAFSGCSALMSVALPNTIITIDDNTFSGCSSLTNLALPNTVTSIGNSAFSGCSSLTCVTIPNSVTSIGFSAFSGCSALTSVTLPNTIITIDDDTFYDCSSLTNLAIPNTVTSIGDYAFSGCSSLTSVTIPNSVSSIGEYAFSYCIGLTSVTIPNSVTSIDEGSFYLCSGLTSVTIPNSVSSIGSYAFYYCSGLMSVTIPNPVTTIGEGSFYGCYGLITINWNATNCTFIGSDAFYPVPLLRFGNGVEHIPAGMPSLMMSGETLVLPNSVKAIDAGAFRGNCDAVVIGDSIENIAAGAFPTGISVAYASSAEPRPCSGGAFSNPQTLYVPAGSKMKYFTSEGWSEFANIVEGEYVIAASLTLNKSTVVMSKGSSLQLIATIWPSNASATSVSWMSMDPAIVTVDSSGMLTANQLGETDIVAMVDNVCAICHVTVAPVMAESLTLSDSNLNLELNDMYTLIATVLPVGAESQALEWIIPDNDVIVTQVVNNTRLNIGAVGTGSVTITVRTTDGSNLSATCVVNVQVSATSIALNMTSAEMTEGGVLQLTATVLPTDATYKTVTWKSSNTSIATVNSDGLVTAKSPGSATITATTTDGTNLSATCSLVVKQNIIYATSISLNQSSAIMTEGDNLQLTATVLPTDATNRAVTWKSSNTSVATVNSDGLVTAKSPGSATIAATTADGTNLSATCALTVNQNIIYATSISLNQSSATLAKGDNLQLTATVLPTNATNRTVTWSSSDPGVARVDEYGLVTALTAGDAAITVTTTDGSNLSASCEVTVTDDVSNYDNYLSMNDTDAFHGDTIVIPVAMTNEASIISFQTDIYLPDGLEVVQEDGVFLIDPSGRMTRTHSLMSETVSSGAIRVLCYSSNYKPFTGSSGDDLFYITLKVADDAEGDYTIYLRNTLFTTSSFDELTAPDVSANVHVKSYMLGDANGSGTVTVTDVVVTSQYVLELNPQPFIFEAADVNADNNVTVTDVTRIAWMVLNPSLNMPMRAPAIYSNSDRMSGNGITLMPGETRTVSILLDNEIDYSAFQLDLALPEGLTASNYQLTDRASGHAFDVNALSNGKTRVLCYSPALEAIDGHEGALLTFDVTATGAVNSNIDVDGIELVTTDCQTVKPDGFAIGVNSVTSVNELGNGKAVARVDYFNVAGQRIEQPESGVTLVVTTYTDGTRTTHKIIR